MVKVFKKILVKYLISDNKLVTIKLGDILFQNGGRGNPTSWTTKQLILKKEISECKYKPPNNKYPTITKDNTLIDGHHRVYSLLKYYDGDYEILVYRSIYSDWFSFWLMLFILILYGSTKNNKLKEDIKKEYRLNGFTIN